jgi:hypothetical protein
MKDIIKILAAVIIIIVSAGGIPHISEGATIHAVLVGDVHDPDIGPGDRKDLGLIKDLLNDVSKNTGMKLSMKVIDDRIDRTKVMNAVKGVNPASDDMVIFYYTGHGYRMRSMKNQWPAMALQGPGDETAGLDQYWVFNELRRKRPRLLLVMADACNNYVSEGAVDTRLFLQSGREKADNYRKLFAESKGAIIASSSRPGQYSYSGDTGSQFTVAFLRTLRQALSGERPTWDAVMKNATRPVMGGQQNPQFAMFESEIPGRDEKKADVPADRAGRTEKLPDTPRENTRQNTGSPFGNMLIQMEASMLPESFSPQWASSKQGWVSDVRAAGTDIARLRELLVTLEGQISRNAFEGQWGQQRSAWIENVRNASTIEELASLMVDCESNIQFSAQVESWSGRRDQWVQRVNNLH